jgi:hypothetical protein
LRVCQTSAGYNNSAPYRTWLIELFNKI